MIRRTIAVLVITVSLSAGLTATASAGELCVRPLPRYVSSWFCIPTS